MAIIGELTEFSLPEVFNMVGHFSGKMRFLGTPTGAVLELHLLRGYLSALFVNQEPVTDILQVQDHLSSLVGPSSCIFEFHRTSEEGLQFDFSISIVTTLMRMACAADEMSASQDKFPDPQTVFVLTEKPGAAVDEDLFLFLRHTKQLLEHGANTEQISEAIRISIPRVQLCLFKLEELGLVRPWKDEEELIADESIVAVPLSPLKILLVEDDPHLASYLRRGLGRVLSLIAIAGSVEDARAYLNNAFQFDAIVCDYALPDGNGMDLFQWLRNERASAAPFLMISGRPRETVPQDPRFGFLAKPFEPQHLLDHLNQMAGAA